MDLNIGAKNPIDGDQVFLVGRFLRSSESPFVLLYDGTKRRRAKRNIQKVEPIQVVTSIGIQHFSEIEYPGWGRVWLRTSRVRGVRELSKDELITSSEKAGSLVLFEHDPSPEDEHAGFFFFGLSVPHLSCLLNREVEKDSGSLQL